MKFADGDVVPAAGHAIGTQEVSATPRRVHERRVDWFVEADADGAGRPEAPPSAGTVPTTVGANVSALETNVRMFESDWLPPVSVAQTCTSITPELLAERRGDGLEPERERHIRSNHLAVDDELRAAHLHVVAHVQIRPGWACLRPPERPECPDPGREQRFRS